MLDQPIIVNVQTKDSQLVSTTMISTETWEHWLRNWLKNLAEQLPQAEAYELSLRLTDDQEIAALNHQYRQENKPTDVLAFAALEVDMPWTAQLASEPLYLGDIVISVETAARQAQDKGHSLELELAWLASHGCLHLLGWDHPDSESLKLMLAEQEKLLRLVDLNFESLI